MITLSAEQESDGSQLSTNPFSLYTTLKIGGNPKPRAGQDKKNEGNCLQTSTPCLKCSRFLVSLFPDGSGAPPWPLNHSWLPPRPGHLGNTFIIASLFPECPASHALFNGPSEEKATHPLTWTTMD